MRSLLKYFKERLSDELIKAYFSGVRDVVVNIIVDIRFIQRPR